MISLVDGFVSSRTEDHQRRFACGTSDASRARGVEPKLSNGTTDRRLSILYLFSLSLSLALSLGVFCSALHCSLYNCVVCAKHSRYFNYRSHDLCFLTWWALIKLIPRSNSSQRINVTVCFIFYCSLKYTDLKHKLFLIGLSYFRSKQKFGGFFG